MTATYKSLGYDSKSSIDAFVLLIGIKPTEHQNAPDYPCNMGTKVHSRGILGGLDDVYPNHTRWISRHHRQDDL